MNPISILASVNGAIRQEIILNEGFELSGEELVSKLNSGKIVTTISHGDGGGLVIQINPFEIIGKVINQEALDSTEISEFELED